MTVNSLKNNFASADYPYKIFFSLDCPFKNIFASNDYPFKPLFSSLDFSFKNLFFLQTIPLKTSFLLKTISLKILFSLAVYPCKNTFFGRLSLEKNIFFSADYPFKPVVGDDCPEHVQDGHVEQVLHQERFTILLPAKYKKIYLIKTSNSNVKELKIA